MIAVVQLPGQLPHVVRWIGRKSALKVVATVYCGREFSAADGVGQLPDDARVCPACVEEQRKAQYVR